MASECGTLCITLLFLAHFHCSTMSTVRVAPDGSVRIAGRRFYSAGSDAESKDADESKEIVGDRRIVYGNYKVVKGDACFVYGNYNKIEGSGCTVIGNYNTVRGNHCRVEGCRNTVYGKDCRVSGDHNCYAEESSKGHRTSEPSIPVNADSADSGNSDAIVFTGCISTGPFATISSGDIFEH